MAEQLQLIAKLVLDTQGTDKDINKLNANLEKVKQTQEEIVALYGEQSAEAKQAAEAVATIQTKLNDAKSAGQGLDEPVKSIKQQLREANVELQNTVEKFGIGSKEAAAAAAKVANLKDTIGDAKTLTDAFNPDAKFKGLANAVQGAAGAFAALQGAQALFGEESKAVQETLLKVQGALALSEGINSVLESKDAFKALGSQATKAFQAIKAGIGSSGIGVLLILLGTIIAYWDDIKGAVSGVSAEQKKLNEASKENLKAQEEKLTAIEGQEQQLKLQGKSERDILKIKIAQTDEAIKAAEINVENAKITADAQVKAAERNQKILAGLVNLISIPITVALSGIDLLTDKLRQFGVISEDTYKTIGNLRQRYTEGVASVVFDPEETRKEGDATIKEAEDQLNKLKEKRAGFQNSINGIDKAASDKRKSDAEKAAQEAQALQDNIFKDRIERAKRNAAQQEEIEKAIQENRLETIQDGFYKERLLLDTAYDAKIQALFDAEQNEINQLKESLKNKFISQDEYNKLVIEAQNRTAEQRKQIDIKYGMDVLAINQRIQEDRLKQEEDTFKLINDIRIAKLKDGLVKEQEQLALNQQARIDALLNQLNTGAITEDEYNKRRLAMQEQFLMEEQALRDKYALQSFNNQLSNLEKTIQNDDAAFFNRKTALEKEQDLLDEAYKNKLISDEEYTKQTEKNKETRAKIAQAEVNVYFTRAKQITDIIGGISELVKKDSKAAKAAAIAGLVIQQAQTVTQITTDTIKSTKAISAKYSGVPGGQIPAAIEIGINVAQGALGIAKAVQAVKKGISDIKGASESGASSGGGADLGGGGATAPIPPQPETTTLDQGQINQLSTANATVRAYVVESDVSGNQDRITRINRAARIS